MFCSISGTAPEDPVINAKTGFLYERRLIESYIDEHHVCPVTKEPLTKDDLISVKTNSTPKPRPPSATSIPSLLTLLQNEWDSLMLETYSMQEQYYDIRKELSHALYQQDAAKRVIARLIKERDEARQEIAKYQKIGIDGNMKSEKMAKEETMEVDAKEDAQSETVLPEDVLARVEEVSTELSQKRRQKKIPEGAISKEDIGKFELTGQSDSKFHSTGKNEIISINTCPYDDNSLLTTGTDKTCVIYDRAKKKSTATLKGHTKDVNVAVWGGSEESPMILTGSADHSIKSYVPGSRSWKVGYTQKEHKAEVTGLSLHPSNDYFLSCSSDGHWGFNDIQKGNSISSRTEKNSSYSSVSFHPDGLIFATGTSGDESVVKVWDVKTKQVAFELPETSQGSVNSLSFSENGYYFATASDSSSIVKIWDLRKLSKIHELDFGIPVTKAKFDGTSQFLGVCGGGNLSVYQSKKWNCLLNLEKQHESSIKDFVFGNQQSTYLASVGADHKVNEYSLA